jgi:hypothetical protein
VKDSLRAQLQQPQAFGLPCLVKDHARCTFQRYGCACACHRPVTYWVEVAALALARWLKRAGWKLEDWVHNRRSEPDIKW